jgi:hypothetical protein
MNLMHVPGNTYESNPTNNGMHVPGNTYESNPTSNAAAFRTWLCRSSALRPTGLVARGLMRGVLSP